MLTFRQSIGKSEGFGLPNARPTKNNNPGDLTFCQETIHFGATHGDPRFAVFPDEATGWEALRRWLSVPAKFDANGDLVGGYCGATIEQAINRFAPPSDGNNTDAYVSSVCQWTGLHPKDTLTQAIIDA